MRGYKTIAGERESIIVIARHLARAVKTAQGHAALKSLKATLLSEFPETANQVFLDMPLWIDAILKKHSYAHLHVNAKAQNA